MSDQRPTLGRIVHYVLNKGDVAAIDQLYPHVGGTYGRNSVNVGNTVPAMVVATFDPATTRANLKVFLDGNDTYWATSRTEGDGPGTWHWPPRV